MKDKTIGRHWGALTLMALLTIALHSVIQSDGQSSENECTCGAGIEIGGGCGAGSSWDSWCYMGDAGTRSGLPVKLPIGGHATATGSAYAGQAQCSYEEKHPADLEIHDTGTGAIITPIYDWTENIVAWSVDNPKKPGTITFKIKATGQSQTGTDDDENPICSPDYTCEVVGTIVVTRECGGGICSSTSGGPSFGSGDAANNSLDFSLYLGASSPRDDAGFLWLDVSVPSGNLADSSLLRLPYTRPNVEVITNSLGAIQQVKVPQGLVNVCVINTNEYHLECFYATNVTKIGGLYTTNAPAFVTWVIEKPNGAPNCLWITEQGDGPQRQFQYTYTASSHQWDLVKPDGQTVSTWQTAVIGDATLTNYCRQVSMGGQVVSKNTKTYQYVAALDNILLTQEVDGDCAVCFSYTQNSRTKKLSKTGKSAGCGNLPLTLSTCFGAITHHGLHT